MKNKQGFSPLEILIALTIGSMITLIVMGAISQLSTTLARTTTLTQADMNGMLGITVLEQDFSSVLMPEYIHYKEKDQKEVQKNQSPATDKKKEEKEYFKKAFFIKQSDSNLEQCSCISMYSIGKDHIAPKKIIYSIEENSKGDGKTYTLYRQECGDLNAEKSDNKNDQKFIVINNIISLKLTMWARPLPQEEKKEASKQPAQADKKAKKEEKKKEPYKSFTQWDSDKNNKEQKGETRLPLLPDYIDIQLVLQREKGREIEYFTTIMTPLGFPDLTLTDVIPIQHQKPQKEKQTAQEQLTSLSNNVELSPFLNDKVSNLAGSMNIGQKEKR